MELFIGGFALGTIFGVIVAAICYASLRDEDLFDVEDEEVE